MSTSCAPPPPVPPPRHAPLTFALQTAVAHLADPAAVGARQVPRVKAAVALDHQRVATALNPRVGTWRVKVTTSAHCLRSSQTQIAQENMYFEVKSSSTNNDRNTYEIKSYNISIVL